MSYDLTKDEYQSNFMEEGRHLVRISNRSTVFSKSNNEGIKYEFKAVGGQTISETYWLSEKSMFRLVILAKACKLEDEKMRVFEPEMLIGRFLEIEAKKVLNENNGKEYLNVTDVLETKQTFDFHSAKADGFGDALPEMYEPPKQTKLEDEKMFWHKNQKVSSTKDPFDDIPF